MVLGDDGRRRVVIEHLKPEIDGGRFPIKRVVGEKVVVSADVFADGHDSLSARLLYRRSEDREWSEVPMRLIENDRWTGEFIVKEMGIYRYTVEGWVDHFKTWQRDLKKRFDAGQDVKVELLSGAEYIEKTSQRASKVDRKALISYLELFKKESNTERTISVALGEELTELINKDPDKRFGVTYEKELTVVVDRGKALFSSWYELFPRSCSDEAGRHGTFQDCEKLLPDVAKMGFDILYFPPIHPVGRMNRKGKNNVLKVNPEDVGSPWAIGSNEGGHKAIHPQLGTLEDFGRLIAKAKEVGMEIAMDLAFQCSPDHPYVKEHPS